MLTIENLQSYIRDQIGLVLAPCDYFSGAHVHKGETYFNLLIKDRFAESEDIPKLERLSKNSSVISRIEPNGLHRVAIFIQQAA